MSALPTHVIRLADLAGRKDTAFVLTPEAEERAAIAEDLGIIGVKKLRFEGSLEPLGQFDWVLSGKIGATVVQECVVTLEPVSTRIDEEVRRTYLRDFVEPEGDEVEMPEDDSAEELPNTLDIAAVMIESLALALPQFPRKDGAELGEAVYSKPGTAPMRDEDARPFAGLASLKESLEKKDKDGQ